MAFAESLKLKIKQKAHFRCCLCRELGVEVHHVTTQEEGGPDIESNAAPLCPTCHERYGANPTKRKFIREARDFWYDLCEKNSSSREIKWVAEAVARLPTKSDLEVFGLNLIAGLTTLSPKNKRVTATESEVVQFLSYYKPTNPTIKNLTDKRRTKSAAFVWDEILWADEPLVHFRALFLDRFGRHGATQLATYCMDKTGISLHPWFLEEALRDLFNMLYVSTVLILTSKAVLTIRPIFDIWVWKEDLVFKKISKRDPFKLKLDEISTSR